MRMCDRIVCRVLQAINAAEVHLVSNSPDGGSVGVEELAHSVEMNRHGRDVYVVGAANIGKSTLVKALTRRLVEANGAFAPPNLRGVRRLCPLSVHVCSRTLASVGRSHLPGRPGLPAEAVAAGSRGAVFFTRPLGIVGDSG